MTFGNIATGDTLEAFFNPEEFEEHVKPEYNKIAILGQSHETHQYKNTTSHGFSFELAFGAFTDGGVARVDDVLFARRYLLSLCYSSRRAQTIRKAVPPRVLFVWPELVSVEALIQDLKIKNTHFRRAGAVIRLVATVSLDEARDGRLYAEDVLATGTIRGTGKR